MLFAFFEFKGQAFADIRGSGVGLTYTNWGTTYTRGYRFTPTQSGRVTALWCYNNLSSTVSLWTDTGTLLAQTAVPCSSTGWASTTLTTPVNLTAGTYYRIAAYGNNYYTNLSYPYINRNTNISGAYYATTSTSGANAFPTNTTSSLAPVDITFEPVGNVQGRKVEKGVAESSESPTGLVINKPADVATGNMMIAAIEYTSDSTTSNAITTVPAGWNRINTTASCDRNFTCTVLYYKMATSSEPANYSWSFAQPYDSAGWVTSYTGMSLIGPVAQTNTATSPHNFQTITTNAPNEIVILAGGNDKAGGAWTSTPAGWNLMSNYSGVTEDFIGGMDKLFPSSGTATGLQTATFSDSTYGAGTVTVALKPNIPPTFSGTPTVSYGSYSRTGPSNNFTISFNATDEEQNGAGQLTYTVKTSGGSTVVSSTAFTSGSVTQTLAYNTTSIVEGDNYLIIEVSDGTNTTTSNQFIVKRDSVAPTVSGITYTPNPVLSVKQYAVTFTPNDVTSTSPNELMTQIRTLTDTGGTQLFPNSGFSSGSTGTTKTTTQITDTALQNGSPSPGNQRWVRVCDGANNCFSTSFIVTADLSTAPTISTPTEASITPETAILGGNVTSDNFSPVIERGVCWGLVADPALGGNCVAAATSGTGIFTVNVTGLTPGTATYHYRAYATNSIGTSYTIDDTFSTPTGKPQVTLGAESVSYNQASLNANVNPSGYSTNAFFKWDQSPTATCATMANTVNVLTAQTGTTNIAFSTTVSGLTFGTDYYYCAGGTNQYGTSYSDGVSFSNNGTPKKITTPAPDPTVFTDPSPSYISRVAQLTGKVNPNGLANTSAWFNWGPGNVSNCSTLPNSTPSQSMTVLNGNNTVTANISGLTVGQQYSYCLVGDNLVNAPVYGAIYQFTAPTGCIPPTTGDFTISSNCQLQNAADGVDTANSPSSIVNTANLIIAADKTLTVGPNKAVGYGVLTQNTNSAIVKFQGAVIKKGPLWVPDSDGDGSPDAETTGQVFLTTKPTAVAPGQYVRRGYAGTNGIDCDPANGNIYQTLGGMVKDSDNDGYLDSGAGAASSQCVGGNKTIGGRVYWKDSAGNYTWLYEPIKLGVNDCNNNDGRYWQMLTGYQDLDGDTYTPGTTVSKCSGSTFLAYDATTNPNRGSLSSIIDCKDSGVTEEGYAASAVYQNLPGYKDFDGDGGVSSGVPTFRKGTSKEVTNGTNPTVLTMNVPAGTTTGHVMVAGIYGNYLADTLTVPAGWNLINQTSANDFSSQKKMNMYWRAATSAEPATYSWSINANRYARGFILTYDNIDTSSPIDAQGAQAYYSSGGGVNTPTITTTQKNDMIVTFFHAGSLYPTGMTRRNYSNIYMSVSDEIFADKGSIMKSAGSGTSGTFLTSIVALRPRINQICSGATLPSQFNPGNDCNDETSALYNTSNYYPDNDGDGVYASTTQAACAATTPPTGFSSTVGTDCDEYNPTGWRILNVYSDYDNDGETVGGAIPMCTGATAPTGYKTTASAEADCYDKNLDAKHGQTLAFSYPRGGAADAAGNTGDSFDYNCINGVERTYSGYPYYNCTLDGRSCSPAPYIYGCGNSSISAACGELVGTSDVSSCSLASDGTTRQTCR